MLGMILMLRWGWFLGIALFMPVALPAGGAEVHQTEICRFKDSSFLLTCDFCKLQTSPSVVAPSLRNLPFGTPLRVIRRWKSNEGHKWLQVKITSNEKIEFSSLPRRGWIQI